MKSVQIRIRINPEDRKLLDGFAKPMRRITPFASLIFKKAMEAIHNNGGRLPLPLKFEIRTNARRAP